MSDRLFDRETLLDISVNVIPLGITLFFVVAGDYHSSPLVSLVQLSIMGLTAVGLLILDVLLGPGDRQRVYRRGDRDARRGRGRVAA